MKKINVHNLKIDEKLYTFVNKEVIPGTGIDAEVFWKGFSSVVHELAPVNKKLLEERVN